MELQPHASSSARVASFLRPCIDLLYEIEQIIIPSRLTKALAQFG